MAIEKRMVVPPGKNTATQEEWFDTELGRVVPKPADPAASDPIVVEAPVVVEPPPAAE